MDELVSNLENHVELTLQKISLVENEPLPPHLQRSPPTKLQKSYIEKAINQNKEMPKVFAFEIESNLRNLIEEVLNPIVKINKENNARLGNVELITKQLDRENKNIMGKLEAD